MKSSGSSQDLTSFDRCFEEFSNETNAIQKTKKYDECISHLQDPGQISQVTLRQWSKLLDFTVQNITSNKKMKNTLSVLKNVGEDFPCDKLSDQIIGVLENTLYLFTGDSNFEEVEQFFYKTFQNKKLSTDLALTPKIDSIIQTVCKQYEVPTAINFVTKLVIENCHSAFFENIRPKTLITILEMSEAGEIKPEFVENAASLFCLLFQMSMSTNPKIAGILQGDPGYNSYLRLISPLEEELQIKFLVILLDSGPSPPQRQIISTMAAVPSYVASAAVFKIIEKHPEDSQRINSYAPFSVFAIALTSHEGAAPKILKIASLFLTHDQPSVGQCIPPLMVSLSASDSVEVYIRSFALIEQLLSKRLCSLALLLEIDFLGAFMLRSSAEHKKIFFTRVPSFAQLVLDVFKLCPDKHKQDAVIDRLLEIITYDEFKEINFASILSGFIIEAPTEKNIKHLMTMVEQKWSKHAIEALQICFTKSKTCAYNFIDMDGLNWILEVQKNEALIPTQASMFYAALVSHPGYERIDAFLKSLPEDHPILKSGPEYVEAIVFGLAQNGKKYRQIRIPSLYHLTSEPNVFDPYNLLVIGKFCLFKIKDIPHFKLLPYIANRFIPTNLVDTILEGDAPLDLCCEPEFDHFPLFQFFPGKGELTFNENYVTCAFWFKFQEFFSFEVAIFKTEVFTINVRDDVCTVECDGNKFHIEVNPTEWNQVIIRLETNIMSQVVHVYVASDEVVFPMKKKIQNFKTATFSSSSQTIMFLGAAIRFSMLSPLDISVMTSRGPGSIGPSADLKETRVVTPHNIDTNILPPNGLPVAYCGFPMHMNSCANQRLLLKQLHNPDKANVVLKAIANVAKVTYGRLNGFYERALKALKESKMHLNEEHFKVLISALSEQTGDSMFYKIFNDEEMWSSIDNGILVNCLLDLFPKINWRNIENGEIAIAHAVYNHPECVTIVTSVLNNIKRIPRSFKYLIALMKAGSVIGDLQWSSLNNIHPSQSTIAQIIASTLTSKQSAELIAAHIPFDELRYLMLSTPSAFAADVLHLIARISKYFPVYICPDPAFFISAARLASIPQAWQDVLVILTEDEHGAKKQIKSFVLMPLLLNMLWSGSAAIIHAKLTNKETPEISKIEGMVNIAIASCMAYAAELVENRDCLSVFLFLFPLILNYPILFQPCDEEKERPPPLNASTMTAAQISDASDPIWSKVTLPEITIPTPELPEPPRAFLRSIVESVFKDLELSLDFTQLNSNTNIVQWMFTSPLFLFMSDLVFKNQAQFFPLCRAFFVGTPFRDPKRPSCYVHVFLHIIMSSMTVPLDGSIRYDQLLEFMHLLAGLDMLHEGAPQIIQDLFLLGSSMVWTFGEAFLKKHQYLILSLIAQLIVNAPKEDYMEINSILVKNGKMLASMVNHQSMNGLVFYIARICVGNLDKVTEFFENQAVPTVEEENKQMEEFAKKFKKIFDDVSVKVKEIKPMGFIDFGAVSRDITKTKFICAAKRMVVGHLYNETLHSKTSFYPLFNQRRRFDIFMMNNLDEFSDADHFELEDTLLSMRCPPYLPPRLLIPLHNTSLSDFHNPPILSKTQAMPMFMQISEKNGSPIFVVSCAIVRYGARIPCVVFGFPKCINIIAFSRLEGDSLVLINGSSEVFDQSTIAGEFGMPTIFDSHIVIEIMEDDFLTAITNGRNVCLWTFTSGSFNLRFQDQVPPAVQQYFKRLDDSVTKSFLFDHLLDQVKTKSEAQHRWTSRTITSFQYLLILNALSSHTFADTDEFPCFPPRLDPPESDPSAPEPFPKGCEINTLLAQTQPFKGMPKAATQSHSVLAVKYVIPELHRNPVDALRLRYALEKEECRIELTQWTRAHFVIMPSKRASFSKVEITPTPYIGRHLVSHREQTIELQTTLPPVSGRISVVKSAVIVVRKKECALTIYDSLTESIYVKSVDPVFSHAKEISVAQNGLLCTVDFDYGEVRSYRILYENDLPVSLTRLCSFGGRGAVVTSVNGFDWLGATAEGSRVIIWDLVTGRIHRVLHFDKRVMDVAFDESIGLLWATTAEEAFVYSVNGTKLNQCGLPGDAVSLDSIQSDHVVVVRFDDGHLARLRFDPFEDKLELVVSDGIDRVSSGANLRRVLSRDASGSSAIFKEGMMRAHYEHCALCTAPSTGKCSICGRSTCEQCLTMTSSGPVCKQCT